jgi:hypothetical protein
LQWQEDEVCCGGVKCVDESIVDSQSNPLVLPKKRRERKPWKMLLEKNSLRA